MGFWSAFKWHNDNDDHNADDSDTHGEDHNSPILFCF